MISSSCTSTGGGAQISELAEPVYPTIFGHELQCLSTKTYEKLNKSRAMCRSRVKTLNAKIKKHNESVK